MGSYFTKLDGKSKEVSNAIFEHYKPKGISDEMPTTNLGGMLSMIDNIDTLTGFFIINKKPSGSKDPFALRRAGFSIVQILMQFKLNISISDLFTESFNSYKNSSKIIKLDLVDFIIDKVRFILKNQNFRDDIITSVFSLKDAKNYLFPILYERVKHINDVKDTSDFKLFLVNFKRLNNIIKSKKLPDISDVKVNPDLFETSEEKEIYNKSDNLNFNLKKYLINLDYQKSILQEIINLQYAINSFFETVIVNHEEKIIKDNRIALLTKLSDSILEFSNFSLIED
jgi:glycyl-tRNA synthetase beta chain